MIECAISAVIVAIIVIVVLWAFEAILTAFGLAVPPPILTLLRVLAVLLIVLWALRCIMAGAGFRIGWLVDTCCRLV